MENIKLNIEKSLEFISKDVLASYAQKVNECMETLEKGTGLGNDFLGWLHLPSSITKEHIKDLKATAQTLRENCEVVVVAGIGGSTRRYRSYVGQLLMAEGKESRTAGDYLCRSQHQRRLSVRTD